MNLAGLGEMDNSKMNDQINLDDFITIICPIHGDFIVTARDHIGENKSGKAYGCFQCDYFKEKGVEDKN